MMGTREKVVLTNIQRFSLHDGPGIRTTVFLKGCSLRCPWCSNPENLETEPTPYVHNGVKGIYGRELSCDELYEELIKDRHYYGKGGGNFYAGTVDGLNALPGGVTFSGGEALLQIRQLLPLLERLKNEKVHTAVESCLFVPEQCMESALRYIDLFYVDIKIANAEKCREVLHGNFPVYLENLEQLFSYRDAMGRSKSIVFRIPVIGGYTDGAENMSTILGLLVQYRPIKVELIKGHNLGASKYESLGRKVPDYREVSDDLLEQYRREIENLDIPAEICVV